MLQKFSTESILLKERKEKISSFVFDNTIGKKKFLVQVFDIENALVDLIVADGIIRLKLEKTKTNITEQESMASMTRTFGHGLSYIKNEGKRDPEASINNRSIVEIFGQKYHPISVYFNAENHQVYASGEGEVRQIFSVFAIFLLVSLIGDKKFSEINIKATSDILTIFEKERVEYFSKLKQRTILN